MENIVGRPELRQGAMYRIRELLEHVSEDLEHYLPDAVILDGSKMTVELELGRQSTVHVDFVLPVRE